MHGLRASVAEEGGPLRTATRTADRMSGSAKKAPNDRGKWSSPPTLLRSVPFARRLSPGGRKDHEIGEIGRVVAAVSQMRTLLSAAVDAGRGGHARPSGW